MNQVLFETTFHEGKHASAATLYEHDHGIYTLIFDLNSRNLSYHRGSNDTYLFGEGADLETVSLPEIKPFESSLNECQCYSSQNKDQVEFIWVPFKIFEEAQDVET